MGGKETHLRRSNPNRTPKSVIAVATCIVIAALYLAREVLVLLALALLMTFLLAPMVRYLERRRVPRIPAVLTIVAALFLLLGLLGWVVVGQVWDLADSIDQYKGNIVTKIDKLQPHGALWTKLTQFGHDVEQNLHKPATAPSTSQPSTEAQAKSDLARTLTPVPPDQQPNPATQPTRDNPLPVTVVQPGLSPIQTLGQYTGLVLGPLGSAGIVIVFVIFMLLSYEDLRDRVIRLVGYGQMHATTRALDDAASRISRYLIAQAIVNGTYGIAISIGLWLIGRTLGHQPFPNVILWGLLCALLRFVPYIGPWIGAAFPLLVSFAIYPGFTVFLAVAFLFVAIELISNNLMEPWLYGSSTGISTIAILVSAVFWTWLWGPIGLLLATPLTVCLVVLGKHVPALAFLDVLLGDEPVLEPHERVYQRLLAMDQEEAADVAEEYLSTMRLEDVYDQVLLPALALGEQDRHRGRLDEERKEFIRDAMRDVVDEAMEQNRARTLRAAAALTEAAAKGTAPPTDVAENPAAQDVATILPDGADIHVVILPAHDPADEIAGTMLANSLITRGYCVTVVSFDSLASEMVQAVERERADIVVVSALPPAAATHARYLCKRLHARFPEIETVVGLWFWKGDHDKARERITSTRSVRLVTSLCEAIDEIHQAVQPILIRKAEDDQAAGE